MVIYLVLNVENPQERWVLDICTSLEKAEELKEQYCNNFKKENVGYYNCDVIKIEVVPITDSDVIWSYEGNTENYE